MHVGGNPPNKFMNSVGFSLSCSNLLRIMLSQAVCSFIQLVPCIQMRMNAWCANSWSRIQIGASVLPRREIGLTATALQKAGSNCGLINIKWMASLWLAWSKWAVLHRAKNGFFDLCDLKRFVWLKTPKNRILFKQNVNKIWFSSQRMVVRRSVLNDRACLIIWLNRTRKAMHFEHFRVMLSMFKRASDD